MTMPKYYFDNADRGGIHSDKAFISEQIGMLPIKFQSEIAKRYSDIYMRLSIEDPKLCRRRSNTWLRKTVDKNKVISTGGYF